MSADTREQIYLNMTAAQKWEQVFQLRELAWKIKTAAIKEKHPDWNDQEINDVVKKIFLYAVT